MKHFLILSLFGIMALVNNACSDTKESSDIRGVYDVTDEDSKTSDSRSYLYIKDSTIVYDFTVDTKTEKSELSKIRFVTGDIHSGGSYMESKNCSKAANAVKQSEAWSADSKAKLSKYKLAKEDAAVVITEIHRLESAQCADMTVKAFSEKESSKE